jgi:hypothetical protein
MSHTLARTNSLLDCICCPSKALHLLQHWLHGIPSSRQLRLKHLQPPGHNFALQAKPIAPKQRLHKLQLVRG